MNAQVPLPPIPQPPQDPTSWLLNARVGWWHATPQDPHVEQQGTDGALALVPDPASLPSLTDPSGSFGGLTLPTNMALGPDGSIFLLDQTTLQLKRFDPCECRFDVVPCFGGSGTGPRQLHQPHGIGICNGKLFVCDTGNQRVSVFALHGFVLYGHWAPPAKPWEPFALAFDGRGRVYVTDKANGWLHRFSPAGHWEKFLDGLDPVTHIAIDCADRIYLVSQGTERRVRIFSLAGEDLGEETRADTLQARFPQLPFVVDTASQLHLGPLCQEQGSSSPSDVQTAPEGGVFDVHGNPVQTPHVPAALRYPSSGVYFSSALDSELYRCQWHRVVLHGEIPKGTSLTVETYTAEVLLTDAQIHTPDLAGWETQQTAHQMPGGAWDCLVRSGGGRYLWLRVAFRSNGQATPRLTSIEIEFPRLSLRRYLPAVFGAEATSADFTDRFLSLFDTTLRGIEHKLDHLARYFDPRSAPAERDPKTGMDFLTWLGSWIGLSLDRHWPEAKRRKLLQNAGRLYNLRGTRTGLWRQLVLFLEMEPEQQCCPDDQPKTRCRPVPPNCAPVQQLPCAWQPPPLILEHYQLRRWLFLGAGRLGEQAVLWGQRIVNRSQLDTNAQAGVTQLITTQDPQRDPFHVYAHKFSVFVPACYGRSEHGRKALENLLRTERPAHTQGQIVYVEPKFRIGIQSMIGFDTVIGRYPAGVTLNQTPLGAGSVLTAPPHEQGGPTLEIGKQSRVGTTTRLD